MNTEPTDEHRTDLEITPGADYVESPTEHSTSGIDPIQAGVDNPAEREALIREATKAAKSFALENPDQPNPFEESIDDAKEGRFNP